MPYRERQKSFFRQDHSTESKANSGQHGAKGANEFSGRPKPEQKATRRPPIKPSVESKNKLNAFAFADPTTMSHGLAEDNKENSTENETLEQPVETAKTPAPNRSTNPIVKDGPKTPAGRLALADLLGDSNFEAIKTKVAEQTQGERVGWEYSKPRYENADPDQLLPLTKRGKKRARSSSPMSSPHQETSQPTTSRCNFDFQSLHHSLRTPFAGLSALSDGERGKLSNSLATPLPGFAHLFETSSPRAPEDIQGKRQVGALSRSLSCGMDWPTCASKRRKVTKSQLSFRRGETIPELEIYQQSESKSKVALLMEKVQDSLLQAPPKDEISASKVAPEASSPSQNRRKKNSNVLASILPQKDPPVSCEAEQHGSSEYGDIEDDDLLEVVNDPLIQIEAASCTLVEKSVVENPPKSNDQPQENDPKSEGDEYDLGDSFDEDMDAILAQETAKLPEAEASKARLSGIPAVQTEVQMENGDAAGSEDEYGSLEVDDLQFISVSSVDPAPALTATTSSFPNEDCKTIKRYLITDVELGSFEVGNGRSRPEKVVAVKDELTKLPKVILLRQSWVDSPCAVGAYIHIIGDFNSQGVCTIDDDEGMLILHPDHLISATVVADSFTCTRRAVLQDRVKATNDASRPQVYGHILHEIFQEAMKKNEWDTESLQKLIENIVSRYIENIYEVKLSVDEAVEYLKAKIPDLQGWAELFISSKPKASAFIEGPNGNQVNVSINKLLDVEEHIWSPMYGLKGNIDATVQIATNTAAGPITLTVPLEVKTGRTPNLSHKAQTALYTLLLSDRYDVEVAYGVLYYLETSAMIQVPAIRRELRHMIMQRNDLACYVKERLRLPPMLKNSHTCNKCYAKTTCMIYHKLIEDGNGETSGLKAKFDEIISHLQPAHKEFFQKWDDLLTKEERDMLRFRRELWTMSSLEREKVARCFANVVIEYGSFREDLTASKINRYHYTLVKSNPSTSFTFVESHISTGEPIVISDEEGHFALANGYVTAVTKKRIKVVVDRRLHNARTKQRGFDKHVNQVFAGIMEVTEEGALRSKESTQSQTDPILYRLDRDEFSNGMALARNNLLQVMVKDSFSSQTLREVIVDLRAPRFKASSSAHQLPKDAELNVDQQDAIEKVMTAQDYALVLGMPGTGKTTTIAHIIRALVSQGKSVLLTSYTHTAVDNILLKIKHDKIRVLRLGALNKVHPEVRDFADLAGQPKSTIEELKESYHSSSVVATTCLGINHAVFNERIFDYCIVDEASQITLPVCLGPIRMAKTFILVGDHNQLPPLVQNRDAQKGGLDISLFKLLSDNHPSAVANLAHQYRMCEEVMQLSNNLIYHGLLKCGNEQVARRTLAIPNPDGLRCYHFTPDNLAPNQKDICLGPSSGKCWIKHLVDPQRKSCFVNIDPLGSSAREIVKGKRIVNQAEAMICGQLVRGLLAAGIIGSDIGVISIYRSQLSILRHSLRDVTNSVEMHTADKYQGRDKEIIIVSLVRSNDEQNVGDLLRDWRRVNVAFTRARTKLLVVGSRNTIEGDPLMSRFLALMDQRQWTYDMPSNALTSHNFEELLTQLESSAGLLSSPVKKRPEAERGSLGRDFSKGPKRGKIDIERYVDKRPVLKNIVNEAIG